MTEKLLVPDIGDFENVEVIELLVKEGQEIKKINNRYNPQTRIKWDGRNKKGHKVPKGSYLYVIKNQQKQLKKGIIAIL